MNEHGWLKRLYKGDVVRDVLGLGGFGWRRRRVAQVVGGAAAAGLIAAVVLPVIGGGRSIARAPASPSWGRCTEKAMLSSAGGQISACVNYRYSQGRIDVSSVAASFRAASSYPNPYFSFTFWNPGTKDVDFRFTTPEFENNFTVSHSTRLISLARQPLARRMPRGDVFRVSLHAVNTRAGSVYPVASVSLTLNLNGLKCPNPDSIGPPAC